jgi:hypothetical protein
MVTANRISPYNDYPSEALPEDVLAEVADLRARGRSWEATATEVGFSAAELRRAVRHDPNFPAALELARKEMEFEAEAETLQRLRKQLHDENAKTAMKAAQCITKYLSDKRRDETRLEVERLRAESRPARERSKAEEHAQPQEAPEGEAEWVAHQRRVEQIRAEAAARDNAIVYLWGGCHKIGETPPDATDTPLHIHVDHTVPDRKVYWVYIDPPIVHPFEGPFLAPPGCRPLIG